MKLAAARSKMFALVTPLWEIKGETSSLKYDASTKYGYDYFINFDGDCIKLYDEYAIRKNINKISPSDTVLFTGHGIGTSYLSDEQTCLIDYSNYNILKGKVVFGAVCDTLQNIGEKIGKIATVFGYVDEFKFLVKSKNANGVLCTEDTTTDDYAKPFMNVNVEIFIRVLEGGKPSEIYNSAMKIFDKYIQQSTGKTNKLLEYNKNIFTYFSNGTSAVPQKYTYSKIRNICIKNLLF